MKKHYIICQLEHIKRFKETFNLKINLDFLETSTEESLQECIQSLKKNKQLKEGK